jgi:exodeoxyribonuclease V beta subunit
MTPTSSPQPFDLTGPLPTGTTVLQASAGTGKTFTIAGLVARYVAEGEARMDELLVVSFSRESTRELRGRVRERLVRARAGLADPPPDDHLLRHLADCNPAERVQRHRRLRDALASFDAATVTTTHGFCQQVLLALGTAGDHDPDAVLVEDMSDLVAEVADDFYLRKWGAPGTPPPELSVGDFRALAAEVAVRDPATPLVPDPSTPGLPGLRARIGTQVRQETERRKRRQSLLGYDDMLMRVQATLLDPVTGPAAVARLRGRYAKVLVDEFQDTDPVQWSILHEAFHGARTLVLIGDPKQAIYAFRGADVHAYLQATEVADTESTLPDNWRSDAELLRGLDAVFRGAALGDPRIRVLRVRAAHHGRLLSAPAAVRLRVQRRDDLPLTQQGLATVTPARDAVAADVAAEITGLLSAGTTVRPRGGGEERDLGPGDVAVLVRTNKQAEIVRCALQEAEVPVVLTGRSDVFATPAALEWQLLLEALEQPHRTTRVRRLALGAFVGRTADQLAFEDSEDLGLRLRGWARVLEDRGVAALFEAVCLAEAVQPRLLSRTGGERLLTDLRHLTEALHEAALEGQLGLTALLSWLRRRREDAGKEGAQERSRRLESDADAVQVITVHTSKGLEFPVVLVPFAWDRWSPDAPPTAVFHDEQDRRVRDVGGRGGPDWAAHVRAHKQDEVDDELRLTYVALTRAQGQLVLWWAGSSNTPTAPLHRLLLHDDPDGVPPASVPVPSDEDAITVFQARAAGSDGGLQVEVVPATPKADPYALAPGAASTLRRAVFGRPLDTRWRRTSYTALTSAAHGSGPALGSEPEIAAKDDETDAVAEIADVVPAGAVPSLWDTLPGGASFGTLVHEVLERVDPADEASLAECVAARASRWSPDLDVPLLTSALDAAMTTPLGPIVDGRTLRSIGGRDRLAELDFELPLSGGDAPLGVEVLLSALAPLWREHVPSGLLSGYPDALAGLEPAPLRGYLTGSIDAVLRVGLRYVVVDYKTNRLGVRGRPLTTWDYRPEALEQAMVDAHYPLQALLYDVALHRYLRWRLPGYDPEVHLGGALYLFLRGMTGADGTSGVFAWRPPAALVTATSDLLAGAR